MRDFDLLQATCGWSGVYEQSTTHLSLHRECTPRLPAHELHHDQPKPRDRVCRGPAGTGYVLLGRRQCRYAGQQRSGQIEPEPRYLDQGWGEFRRQLEYKQAWRGDQVLAVPPRNTSRSCSVCTHVSAHSRRNQSQFRCVNCGFEDNADVVGALNVLAAGLAVLACGGTVRMGRPMKQEPAEVSQAA